MKIVWKSYSVERIIETNSKYGEQRNTYPAPLRSKYKTSYNHLLVERLQFRPPLESTMSFSVSQFTQQTKGLAFAHTFF